MRVQAMPPPQLASTARLLLSLRSVKAAPCMAPCMICPPWALAGLGSGQRMALRYGRAHQGAGRGFASCAAAPGRASTLHADSTAHGQQPALGWPPSKASDPDAAPQRAHVSAAPPEPRAHGPPAPAGRDAADAAGRAEAQGRLAVQRGAQAGAGSPGASMRPEPAAALDRGPLETGAAPAAAAQARPGSLSGAPRPEPGGAAAAAASAAEAGAAQRRDPAPQVGGGADRAASGLRAPSSSGEAAMSALEEPRSFSVERGMLAGQTAPGANGATPVSGPGEQGLGSAGSHAAASNGASSAHRAAAHGTYICELRLRYERRLWAARAHSLPLAKHPLPLLSHLAVSSSCALHGFFCRPASRCGNLDAAAGTDALAAPRKRRST